MRLKEIAGKYDTSNVRRGIIRTKTSDTELDSATIVVTQVIELDMCVYDIVELTNEFGNKEYWLVVDFQANIVRKSPTILYDYTINVCHPTKLLETNVLPNMAITQIGQQPTRKLSTYLKNVFNEYFKNSYVTAGKAQPLVSLNSRYDIDFVEATFTQPTLREYLDYLMSFVTSGDAPYRAKLDVIYASGIYYLTLTDETLNPKSTTSIDLNYVDDLVISQNAADYVSDLVSEHTDIVLPTTITEYHKFKSKDYIFTSDNANIVLNHKPYDITDIRLWGLDTTFELTAPVYIATYNGSNGNYYVNTTRTSVYVLFKDGTNKWNADRTVPAIYKPGVSIKSQLVTSAEYGSLTIPMASLDSYSIKLGSKYKNNTIYWERGSDEINGFNYAETRGSKIQTTDAPALVYAAIGGFLKTMTKTSINLAIWNETTSKYDEPVSESLYQLGQIVDNGITYHVFCGDVLLVQVANDKQYNFKNVELSVTYKPYGNCKIKQSENQRHYVEMPNSGTNANTDIIKYYEQSKINNKMLGNKTISIYGHSDASALKFALGMVYNFGGSNYYLNKLEYTIRQNTIEYKGTMTKDYANRDINTTLNREKRYFSLPDATEAVDRHEIFEASLPSASDLITKSDIYVRVCSWKTNIQNEVFSLPVTRTKLDDNTYLFNFEMMDNVDAAFKLSDSATISGTQLYTKEVIRYTDDNGECFCMNFQLFSSTNRISDYSVPNGYSSLLDVTLGNSTRERSKWLKDGRERIVVSIIVNVY